MEGRKTSQQTLVEHISAEISIGYKLSHRWFVGVCLIGMWDSIFPIFKNRCKTTTVIKKGTTNVESIFKVLER